MVRGGGGPGDGGRAGDRAPPQGKRLTVLGGIATWTGPALFAALATAVFLGDPSAPLLALLAVLSPLAVLVGRRASLAAPEPSATTAAAGLAAVGAALGANLLAAVAAAVAAGVPPAHALALVGALACASAVLRRAAGARAVALVLGMGGLTAIAAAMGVTAAAAPWAVWAQLASRPAFAFAPGTAWVDEGRTVVRPTTLTFAETHRVTAVSPGLFRVIEPGARGETVRERRLAAGESLTLRAGDRLALLAGARVRFEAGKRIPGAAASGIAWAEPRWPPGRALLEGLGLAVTLAGGAAALVGRPAPATRASALAAPVIAVALVLVAVAWGVYAAGAATDFGLGAAPLAPLVEAAIAALRADDLGWPRPAAGLGLFALLVATTAGLRTRLESLLQRGMERGGEGVRRFLGDIVWVGLVGACALLTVHEVAPEALLWLGLGLGASAWAAPRLAGGAAGAAAGSAVGAVAFGTLAAAGALGLPGVGVAGAYPALVAAPLAAAAAAARRARVRRARRGRASVARSGGR